MSGFPSADDVARAIVAACRETGDDPIVVASRQYIQVSLKKGHVISRIPAARHYAYHALAAEFPDAASSSMDRIALARCVGCQKKAYSFVNLTRHQIPKKAWFSWGTVEKVRAVVRAGRPVEASCRYSVGDRVSHTTYGDGRVAEVGPYNARRRDYALQVDFDRGSSQAIYTKVLATAAPMRSSVTETKSRPETPVAVAVARELAPLAAAPVTRLVDGWAGKIALRREPSAEVDDRASELMGDPPPARSALAGAEPWRPYEERAHHSGGGF